MALYLYALLAEARGKAPRGVRVVRAGRVLAAVRSVKTAPGPSMAALRAHDRVVRALAKGAEAILPARFGTVVEDERALARALKRGAGRIAAALREVEGREQMTVRVFATETDMITDHAPRTTHHAPRSRKRAGKRSGTEYLMARAKPDEALVAPLRSAVAALVAAERTSASPPAGARDALRATVYHLIARGSAKRYRAAAAHLPVAIGGPYPPYAFVPDLLT